MEQKANITGNKVGKADKTIRLVTNKINKL